MIAVELPRAVIIGINKQLARSVMLIGCGLFHNLSGDSTQTEPSEVIKYGFFGAAQPLPLTLRERNAS